MEKVEMETVMQMLYQAKESANRLKERFRGLIKSEDVCYTLASEIASSIDCVWEKLSCMGATKSATGDDNHHVHQFPSSKRKELSTWSDVVELSGKGEEVHNNDGYRWRKYGQKKILNSKHPRAYYRCRNRFTHKCPAKKHMQKRNDDSRFLDVEYMGEHTCDQEKPKKHKQNPISCNEQQDQQQADSVNEVPFHYHTTATESVALEAQFLDEFPGESYSAPSIASPCLVSGFIESFYNPNPFESVEEILNQPYC